MAPFWAKSSAYAVGRDPLGIQNSSMAMYSKLLPGMTNPISRIRYYGFYCWVLEEYQRLYADRGELTDDVETQHRFIRRSELLLAFIMHINFYEVTGVSGNLYASNRYDETTEEIDIGKGALKKKAPKKSPYPANPEAYWQYPSGGFGQYFLGSLTNLGLVEQAAQARLFIRTERGKALADAFDRSIPPAEKERFLRIVEEGIFRRPDFDQLNSFAIHGWPFEKHFQRTRTEWQYYLDMLAREDEDVDRNGRPLALRRETIQSLLRYIQNGGAYEDFPRFCYEKQGFRGRPEETDALMGWYYYQLNEEVHFTLENVLWAILGWLEYKGYPIPMDVFLEEVEAAALGAFSGGLEAGASLEKQWPALLRVNESWSADAAEPDDPPLSGYAAVIAGALPKLVSLFEENRENLAFLEEYAFRMEVIRNGAAPQVLRELVEQNLERDLHSVYHHLLLWVINDHLAVAFEKLGTGNKDVSKLAIEDMHIRFVNPITPTYTTPRLGTLNSLLTDLGLLAEGKLTEKGAAYLSTL